LVDLSNMLSSPEYTDIMEATTALRRILSIERNPPITECVDAGVVPRLVNLLTVQDTSVQLEASWALTNIASGTSQHTMCVIEAGAVPIFVSLISSLDHAVSEQAIWTLGNIAGDSVNCRDFVINCGALGPLLSAILNADPAHHISILRNATWCLSNLVRGSPKPVFDPFIPALSVINKLLDSSDETVLTDACWAVSFLSDNCSNETLDNIINADVGPHVVSILEKYADTTMAIKASIVTPALRFVGNVASGNDVQTQALLNMGVLPVLKILIQNPKRNVRKESCWTISNITAGSTTHIQAILDAGLLPLVVQQLSVAEFDVKKEACWAIANATTGGSHDQIMLVAQSGCIPPILDLLLSADRKIVGVAVEALYNIVQNAKSPEEMTEVYDRLASADAESKLSSISGLDEDLENKLSILSEFMMKEEED